MGRPRRADGRTTDPLIDEFAAHRRRFGSQRKVAVLAGMQQSQISEIESGVSSPTLTTLRRMLAALGSDLAIVKRSETFVRVDPSVHFGAPTIAAVPVDLIAQSVWAGETVDTVAGVFGLTTAQVLVACWYQARYGTSTWTSRWGDWARAAEPHLWHGTHDQVDDPPAVHRA